MQTPCRQLPETLFSGPLSGSSWAWLAGLSQRLSSSSGVRADGRPGWMAGRRDAEPPGLSVTYPHLQPPSPRPPRGCACCSHLLFLAAGDGGKGEGVETAQDEGRELALPAAGVVSPLRSRGPAQTGQGAAGSRPRVPKLPLPSHSAALGSRAAAASSSPPTFCVPVRVGNLPAAADVSVHPEPTCQAGGAVPSSRLPQASPPTPHTT